MKKKDVLHICSHTHAADAADKHIADAHAADAADMHIDNAHAADAVDAPIIDTHAADVRIVNAYAALQCLCMCWDESA